jgi:DNA-directed RNA polymerase specialized sigma24 family protein
VNLTRLVPSPTSATLARLVRSGPRPPTLTSLAGFQELPEHRLTALRDDQLIDYMRRAREAGRHDAMKLPVGVLVYGYWDSLVNRARLKLPSADAENVAGEAVASAIASAFDGRSIGEFRSWLHTILSRRIADHLESRKRKPRTTQLPSEHEGDEDVWGSEPAVEFEGEALFARECLQRAYDEIDDPRHRQVIDLYVLGAHAAADTAALVGDGMTEANVHQISSRFQRRFKGLLEGGNTSE